jgi:hypothetical protein
MDRAQMITSQSSRKAITASKPKASASPGRAKVQTRKKGAEGMLARVEAVRLAQRQEGHFDCFGKAKGAYCDQGGCAYHVECLGISQQLS